ncbi:hypothetical protein HMPREF0645_2298 [Hallella bergensis DSM 17361]|uniref:Uncharacterized protein n=1 Tax=Hallella bergensis DSM 17361 TaxID=585502 RepID=D1PZB3_9BACT|nr:hypothetical protein HMPREF0645_2298 [Hallella bergensis DSM 17361]
MKLACFSNWKRLYAVEFLRFHLVIVLYFTPVICLNLLLI